MPVTKKPNCYKCKYRGTIPGDAHSQCKHPDSGNKGDVFEAMALALLPNPGVQKLGIQGNSHGIKNGWFYWPGNFDPVWLESCNGFEAKE